MTASSMIDKIVRVLAASLFATGLSVSWSLSACAAEKKGGGANNAQINSARHGTANSPLGDAAKSGATQGAAGGRGRDSNILKKAGETSGTILQNMK